MTRIGPVPADRMEDFLRSMGVPFSFSPSDEDVKSFIDEWDHAWLTAAFDDEDRIVATFGSFPFEMQVPGGSLPTGGTTVVTVMPTHRRQGLLTKLMRDHLDTARERGQAMTALWASETVIYGRFGYGIASEDRKLELPAQHAKLLDEPAITGTMRFVDPVEALGILPSIFERAHADRPGVFARNAKWWEKRTLSDHERHRGGFTSMRITVHTRSGEDVGYALWRTKEDKDGLVLQTREVVGVDAEAERAVWQFLFGVDLVGKIEARHRPLDDPLHWWLENPRALEQTISDALWVRPLDVKACLEGRRYRTDGTLVLEVSDPIYEDVAGTYRLTVVDGVGTVERTSEPADLELSVGVLGSLLMGGHGADLGRAGRLRGPVEAIDQADLLFGWPVAPFVPEVF